jgi:hypothetical protein
MRLDPLYFWLAVLAICFGIMALVLLLPIGDALELSITGHSAGAGYQNLSFAGDLLNVSIQQNGSSWNLSIGGQA